MSATNLTITIDFRVDCFVSRRSQFGLKLEPTDYRQGGRVTYQVNSPESVDFGVICLLYVGWQFLFDFWLHEGKEVIAVGSVGFAGVENFFDFGADDFTGHDGAVLNDAS